MPTGPARSGRPDDKLRMMEGASDLAIRLRRRRIVESRAPSTVLRAVPFPRFRGAGKIAQYALLAFFTARQRHAPADRHCGP